MKRIWLDLGDLGAFVEPAGPFERWQDHGLGLLRTILHRHDVRTDLCSLRALRNWEELPAHLSGYDMLLLNVRSYTFPLAREAAQIFKRVNPNGLVVTGGMHATVAPDEMEAVAEFDHICSGPGEQVMVDLASDPSAFPRMFTGTGSRSMNDWPMIDRELWPRPDLPGYPWPLEPECGWGPGPVATILTSRVCPWQCAFCNEASYIANMGRRSPEAVIDELNFLDARYGPIGSVVIHDSMFFQQASWLEAWLDAYPRLARRHWPYWAAARADTVRRWPELFEALIRETNWHTISIGFESGSDGMLRVLNKECSAADNAFTIDLLNRIGDDYVRQGKEPPKFWANIILAIPGESREDAFATMRMVRAMRYCLLSPAFYSPYPGSALGYQLIAEGSSLLTKETYHRYPSDEKVKGIDYGFYRDLLAGRFENEIARGPQEPEHFSRPAEAGRRRHRFFLFEMHNGKQKLTYGASPADALAILETRAGRAALDLIDQDRYREIKQRDLQQVIEHLG